MLFTDRSASPLRLACQNFNLFVLALATLLLPSAARAQTTYSGGGASFAASTTNSPSPTTSTITVSGAPSAVATVQVVLLGVKSDGESFATGPIYNSMAYAEFLLEGPGGEELVLLAQTGDTIDGCDVNANADACDGLQGTISPASNPDTITIEDGAHQAPLGAGSLGEQWEGWQTAYMPYTVEPTSSYIANGDGPPPLPTTEDTADYPAPDGSATLNGRFAGTTANGNWTLYLIDNNFVGGGTQNDPISITGWNLILTFAEATPTTTMLSSTANPAYYANTASSASVTFTATVTSGSGTPTGTVTFQANGSNISGCTGLAVSGGVAQCTTSLVQGDNSITAAYTPSGSFGQSDGSLSQMVEVTAANPSGDQWCNNSLISDPNSDAVGLAYPSVIKIPNTAYPGKTVANVSVELEGVAGPVNGIAGQFLLVAPSGANNLDFLEYGFTQSGSPTGPVNLTFEDSAGEYVPTTSAPASGTYLPTDNNGGVNPDTFNSSNAPSADSSIPQVPATINFAAPYGSDNTRYTHTNILTFGEAFNGASADGAWALYSLAPESLTVNSGWCITLTLNTGTSTTTSVTSNQNPGTTGQPVTITATVTSGGNPVTTGGTVTFTDTTGSTPVTLASGVQLNGSGQASFSTSSLTEGDHEITANYSGVTNEDNASFGSFWQRINTATTATQLSSTEWKYCNPGAVEGFYPNPAGPFTPNPSNIFVTNLPGTLNTVAVQLTSFSVPVAENLDELESLVEGPTGAALDFFSNTTQGASGNSTASSGNYIFEDSAGSLVSSGNTNISSGDYKPTAYESYLAIPDSFTSSLSSKYPAPTAFSYASPTSLGSDSTFADVFTNGSNANGTWSLFFNTTDGAQGTIGAANGWCVNLIENLPAASVEASHNSGTGNDGDFVQGEQNAQLTVSITNNGPGPTGDPTQTSNPMTVTDNLTDMTFTGTFTGSGWTCIGGGTSTATCTNESAVADGSPYPLLTFNVNVGTTTGSISNSVTASGAGVSSITSSPDSITVDPAPVTISENFSAPSMDVGGTATLTFTFDAPANVAQTNISLTDTLPAGLQVAANPGAGGTCTGTFAPNPGDTQLNFGGGSLSANGSCSESVNVTALSTGTKTNTTGAVSSTPGGTGLTASANITVGQPPSFTSASSTVDDANLALNFPVNTTGGTGTVTLTVSNVQNAISGITVPSSGAGSITLGGTPTAAGTETFTITATDSVGGTNSQNFTLIVNPLPAIGSASSTTLYIGTALNFTATASGGTGVISLTVSNIQNAIPGIVIPSSGTGSIAFTGTPTATGTETFTITATDSLGGTNSQSFTLTVSPPPNLVVNETTDDAGAASNCVPQPTPGTTANSDSCSLRDALTYSANAGTGNISFDSTVFASAPTITETNGTLAVPANTAILGLTSGSGGSLKNLVTVTGATGSVFSLASGLSASLSNLNITGGSAAPGNGGGIDNLGTLTVTGSAIYNNSAFAGGGIFNDGTLTVAGSSFYNNTASSGTGGGIFNYLSGTLAVTNSTFYNNSAASSNGGAIGNTSSTGTVTVADSTISGNSGTQGGGISNGGSTFTIGNSIVAGNTASSDADATGAFADGGSNLIGDGTGISGITNGSNGDQVGTMASPISAKVAPLTIYGGATETMVPLPGSPAICAGSYSAAQSAGVTADQRGVAFGSTGAGSYCSSGSVDIGAVQTDYALSFTTEPPSNASANVSLTPNPAVGLKESGVVATVPTSTVTMSDSASLLGGTTTASLSSGSATFSNLVIKGATNGDQLTASISLNPDFALNLLSPPSNGVTATLVAATLSSPVGGTAVAGPTVTFKWNAVPGVSFYNLRVGTTPGANNLYSSGDTYATSATATGLPTHGETIYVELITNYGATQVSNSYTYTVAAAAAAISSPTPSTALPGSSVTFTWSAVPGAYFYNLRVGTTPGANNLYGSGDTTATSAMATGLPTHGETVYVELITNYAAAQASNSYTYTVAAAAAAISSPTPSTALPGSAATFTWNAVPGAYFYNLRVGTTPGANNLYGSGDISTTSAMVTGLPINGETIYVELITNYAAAQASNSYTYTAVATAAAISSPTPSTTLPGSSVQFTWNAVPGAYFYNLRVGTTPGANNLYGSGDITTTSVTPTGLPTNGGTIYVELITHYYPNTQVSNSYTYMAAP